MEDFNRVNSLGDLVKNDLVFLGRGRVISSIDMNNIPGDYPVYSSSSKKEGLFGKFGSFDFDEELITWSVDGGGYFFYRPQHKFSITNVSGVLKILDNSKLDYRFLYYLLDFQHRNQIYDYVNKAHPSVIKKRYFIPDIGIVEQNKIAEILTKVDKAISQTEAIIEKQKRIKTGLIQDLLTNGIDKKGVIRNEKTHQYKDSPLGRIPIEWECLELRKCIELHNNKRKPISALQRAKMLGDFPYYGATGIIDFINIYNVEGEFVLFGEDGDHFLKWKKQEQTILVDGKFNVSNHAHVVKGNKLCSTKWLHYFYFHRDITFYLTRQGAGRFKLNKESLSSLPILIPKDFKEQIKIIEKIEYLNNFINIHKVQNEKLQVTKTGLMQDLLSGRKRVTHLIN